MHVIAAKAVAFGEALEPSFRDYAVRVIDNARVLAATLGDRGYHVVTGGTDSHLFLVVGGWMADVLDSPDDRRRLDAVRDHVRELCLSFPLYRGLLKARRDPVPIAP
jgi:glycine hydroxymethyltransferase